MSDKTSERRKAKKQREKLRKVSEDWLIEDNEFFEDEYDERNRRDRNREREKEKPWNK